MPAGAAPAAYEVRARGRNLHFCRAPWLIYDFCRNATCIFAAGATMVVKGCQKRRRHVGCAFCVQHSRRAKNASRGFDYDNNHVEQTHQELPNSTGSRACTLRGHTGKEEEELIRCHELPK